ncbi:MAG: phosphoserine phosphatase SerB, partial [Alphaproteobacteria bacterium]
MFIATLIASERLAAGDISAAEDRVRSAGATPIAPVGLDEGVACDIRFEGDSQAVRAALEGAIGGV